MMIIQVLYNPLRISANENRANLVTIVNKGNPTILSHKISILLLSRVILKALISHHSQPYRSTKALANIPLYCVFLYNILIFHRSKLNPRPEFLISLKLMFVKNQPYHTKSIFCLHVIIVVIPTSNT